MSQGDEGRRIASWRKGTRGKSRRRLLLALVLAALVVALGTSLAGAEESASPSTFYPASSIEEAAEATSGAAIEGAAPDPQAAEEVPLEDLGREEAGDLLVSVFGEILEEPSSVYADLDIEAFRSDYAAVVPAEQGDGSGPGLLTSTLPLRAEDGEGQKSVVDLGLVQSGGELEVVNPLVDVEIPAELGEGIEVPDVGVTVELAGAPAGRVPTALEETSAFYPNVATDSDLTVVPTPTGFETFTQLRSADAPTTQTFDLDLPSGAVLQATEDGGAAVKQGGETLMAVYPPTAIDAAGQPVPVDLAVSDHSIELSVDPPPFAAYPILLDPIFETYMWVPNSTSAGLSDWIPASTSPLFTSPWLTNWGGSLYIGLGLKSVAGSIAPGMQSNWNYYVPRYFTDSPGKPTSYIKSATLSQVKYWIDPAAPPSLVPFLAMGIWSINKGQWVSVATRNGSQGPWPTPISIPPLPNPDDVTDASNVGVGLLTGQTQSYPTQAIVGQATVELSDKDDPAVGSLGSASQWVNESPASPISYSVSDTGLGAYELELKQPKASGGTSIVKTSVGCVGSVSNPCPRTLTSGSKALSYEPKTMPQGENWLKFAAIDPIGRRSDAGGSAETKVKVDHTKPTLTLSGTATEQVSLGTELPSYNLKYDAADGDAATPEALSPFGSAGTGAGQFQRAGGVAVDASGNVWAVDPMNNRVTKFDSNGGFLLQFGSTGSANGQFSGPKGIAIGTNGSVWVVDSGNKRLQQFSATGTFIRKFDMGTASNPAAIVTVPGESAYWVIDGWWKAAWKYKEDGTYLAISKGKASDPTYGLADLVNPVGGAVDAFGNLWVADQGTNRIVQYGPDGIFKFEFGTAGTGAGQLSGPRGIAIAPSGNLLITDEANRVQVFRPDGTYLRQFGTSGSGSGQLSEPQGLAVLAGNKAYVADAGNKRIARWAHADLDHQSGVVSTEVKLDGQLVEPKYAPGCAAGKNCAINNKEWTLNADKYSVGAHNLEVIATDGVGLTTPKSFTIWTHGDLVAPTVAPLTGSLTEQATLGKERPSYKIKISATDPGGEEERKSGVASVELKVDGKLVDSSAPGCPNGGCSLSKEWTLQSDSYAEGSHVAALTATDAAGRSTTKTVNFAIQRDKTVPVLTANSAFFTAPEGWLEQKTYIYTATSSDSTGYGVTSMSLKVDGKVVRETQGSCPAGGCNGSLGTYFINMTAYDGGAHPAELIAKDGAGNTAKKVWTINVDPKGAIEGEEAQATLESIDDTASVNTVGVSESESDVDGSEAGLELSDEGAQLSSDGAVVPSTIEEEAGGAITIDIAGEVALSSICFGGEELEEELDETQEQAPTGGQEEEIVDAADLGCSPTELATAGSALDPIKIVPETASTGAEDAFLTDASSASVSTNIQPNVDLVTRPLYDGTQTFMAIRDPSAPSEFSWKVWLDSDQELKAIDSQHAQVRYKNGGPLAFSITATEAHDAVGTTVPTTLTVSDADTLTLTVHHAGGPPGGGSFVYPVVGGAGWQGGFQTYTVEIEEAAEEPEEGGLAADSVGVQISTVGPPSVEPAGSSLWTTQPVSEEPKVRNFKFTFCKPHKIPNTLFPPGEPSGAPWDREQIPKVVSECRNPEFEGIFWATSVHGRFHYKVEDWVILRNDEFACKKWGEESKYFALVNCHRGPSGVVPGPISAIGHWRFKPGKGEFGYYSTYATCWSVKGDIYPRKPPPSGQPFMRPMDVQRDAVQAVLDCDWPY